MPSPMDGSSSREGDLYTVKHELKNGNLHFIKSHLTNRKWPRLIRGWHVCMWLGAFTISGRGLQREIFGPEMAGGGVGRSRAG